MRSRRVLLYIWISQTANLKMLKRFAGVVCKYIAVFINWLAKLYGIQIHRNYRGEKIRKKKNSFSSRCPYCH